MAVINNAAPAAPQSSDNGMGFLLGVILIIIVGGLFFYYGLPMIRSSMSGPSINVPSKVDVNVHNK